MSNIVRWYSSNSLSGHFEAFSYKDGIVYSDNLSEELDSMTIILSREEKRSFESFDKIEVFNDNFIDESKLMLIDSVVENQVTFDNPILYDYTIKLMSLTKGLERVVLPNISITKPKSGIAKDLIDVISDLIQDYSPKKLTSNNQFNNIYSIDYTELEVLYDIECPDLQMSKPTLREAIDRIMSVANCICYVDRNLHIKALDLNQRNNPINLTNLVQINYQDENQSSADYASELENTYNNVTPNTISNIHNFTTVTEYTGFRNNNTALLTTDNMRLETNFPIYEIQKVRIMGWCSGVNGEGGQVLSRKVDADITSYIKEKREFDILSYNEKQKSLFYERGNNIIAGNAENYGWWIFVETGLENILKEVTDLVSVSKISGTTSLADTLFFNITYQSQTDNIRAKSGKYLPETNENNSMIDNPSESFVDIKQQGTLFNQKVNRLGNRVKVLTGRFKASDKNLVPVLGDYLDDYVVINRELQYRDDFILVKLILTENFVNINYFTGINARKRSWQIVGAEEAFNKQLLDKWYCELSFSSKTGADNTILNTDIGKKLSGYLANPVNYNSVNYISHIIITNDYLSDGYDIDKKYIELELNSYISGNSLIFNFGFLDNYSAPLSLGTGDLQGGIQQKYNKYTNSYGQCNSFNILLLDNRFVDKFNFDAETYLIDGNLIAYSKQKPRLTIDNYNELRENNVIYETNISNNKDNRETPNFNIQFEFCSDTPDIVIGRKFIERQQLISLLPCSNNLIDGQITIKQTPDTPVYEEQEVTETDNEIGRLLQEGITVEYQNYSVVDPVAPGLLVGSAQVYEESESEAGVDDLTRTQIGNYWYGNEARGYFSFLANVPLTDLTICSFKGLSEVIEIEKSNNILTGFIKYRVIGTVRGQVDDVLRMVKRVQVSKSVYGFEHRFEAFDLLGYEPATGLPGTPGYGGITNLMINQFAAGNFTNTITKEFSNGKYYIIVKAYSFTHEVYLSYSFKATSYKGQFNINLEAGLQNATFSFVPVTGSRIDNRNTLSYNQSTGVLSLIVYCDNYDTWDYNIEYTYQKTTQVITGYTGTYQITKDDLVNVEVYELAITGDSRNTVSFNKGIFTYTIYTTGSTTSEYTGYISYGYYGKAYKLYFCSKKYKYGEEKLHDSIQEAESWSYNVISNVQYYALIDILHGGAPSNTKSIAIVDSNNNLILAINKNPGASLNSTTLYLNLLKTRDRKKYINASMTEWL